ncbi:MAG TPA: hypothetical protein VFF14_02075 [Candidatus Deferrimicrobium sp.]|nr:hypothetical protein [Candidatus Deferrimicrobium sp.]
MIKRSILVGVTIVSLALLLGGCGAKETAKNNSGTIPESQQGITQNKTAAKIDIKTSQGQAQVDQKIDSKLQGLDNALDKLDKSMGELP